MAKTTVLVTTLIALIINLAHLFDVIPDMKSITTLLSIISWLAVPFVVFADAKERERKHGPWSGLCFLTGWVGGLIYYFTIKE